jgi:mycofactocin system FadH/OYE family oxidoreductase 2
MANQFEYLFTSLKIGPITVRNRIVLAAHVTGLGENHLPTERLAYYLAERAKGGAGLIISELTSVHPNSLALAQQLGAYDESAVPGFRLVAEMVHENGAKIIGQLAHQGRQCGSLFTRLPVWAPSRVPSPRIREIPHIMTVEEIQEAKEGFVKSASNFQAAGYDGIEIHGAHGYMINQFMSPFTNQRTDAYGGSLENRLRFAIETIDAVRGRIGDKMVLGIRISGDELVPGGLTLNDMQEITRKLEGTGKLDYISVSVGIHESHHIMIGDMSVPLGVIVYLASGIKEVVNLPVLAVLRINDPVQAEQILAEGKADMIGMVRALICDPELPNKAREGGLDDIRKCMADNQECRRVDTGTAICCTQNPTVGFEKELGLGTIKPGTVKKRVLIIGGGPGGLEAARMAAVRGHQVALFEKSHELGGQVKIASKVQSRAELGECTRYLSYQVKKLGVLVKLGVEATAASIVAEKPDVVILATGSTPFMRKIPGIAEGKIEVTNVRDVLEEKVNTGDNVVIFDYPLGFWQCCDTAEFLAEKGKKVTVVTALPFVGMSLPNDSFRSTYERLLTKDVTFLPHCDIRAIKGRTLVIFNIYDKKEQFLENIDHLVLSLGGQADDGLYHELKNKVKELYLIGDCVAPRKIPEAIREGHLIGRRI